MEGQAGDGFLSPSHELLLLGTIPSSPFAGEVGVEVC